MSLDGRHVRRRATRRALRMLDPAPDPDECALGPGAEDDPDGVPRCSHRDPEDDFFCLRYGVWYPSFDCAIRTEFRTAPGCLDCEQGRFNLKRHRGALAPVRARLIRQRNAGG